MKQIDQIEITALGSLDLFKVALLRFTLSAEERVELPWFSGSTFRGAFGAMFRRIACAPTCQDVNTCMLASQCAYARIFEAKPNKEGYSPASDGGLPKPFIIHPPLVGRSTIDAGDSFSFHMALIGFAAEYMPYFILAWRELGRIGIGRGRGRFRLLTVESCLSLEDSSGDDLQMIYSSADELVRNRMGLLTAERLLAMNPRLRSMLGEERAAEQLNLRLEIITPMRLKMGGEFLRAKLPFDVLIGALLRRLESLSYFYCGGSLQLDYQQLLAKAKNVQTVSSHLRWVVWERFSRRQDRCIPWGGIRGCVTYSGDFRPFLPFLALGEIAGVGNNCAFGLGRYKVSVEGGFFTDRA